MSEAVELKADVGVDCRRRRHCFLAAEGDGDRVRAASATIGE